MILRKPYAFLIKYFKIIHIIIFDFFVYFVFVLRRIHVFFVNYAKTGNFVYIENMAQEYVPFIMYILAIIVTISAILIFLLMHKKEKPVFFYRILIVYSVFLLVALSFYTSFFVSLADTTYASLNIVIYRDIISFLYYINFFYVGFSFIRGFGFDIKKFSFDKDKKELNLEEEDNEEFEVGSKLDKDTFISYINRQRRELKYYIRENALILSIIGFVLILGLGFYIYNYFFVTNKVYNMNDVIEINKVSYRVNDVILENEDKYGESISKSHNFIIVNLGIYSSRNLSYDNESFRLIIGDKYYYPVYNYNDSFSDLGDEFFKKEVKANLNKKYLMIFKVDKNSTGESFFEILKSKGNGQYTYDKMKIDIREFDNKKSEYNINDTFKIGEFESSIEEYEIKDSFIYQYEECNDNNCNNYSKVVKPKLNSVVLRLKIRNATLYSKDYMENSFGLIYDSQEISRKNMEVISSNKDDYYFSVPKGILNAKKIILKIKSRELEYIIKLSGEDNE